MQNRNCGKLREWKKCPCRTGLFADGIGDQPPNPNCLGSKLEGTGLAKDVYHIFFLL